MSDREPWSFGQNPRLFRWATETGWLASVSLLAWHTGSGGLKRPGWHQASQSNRLLDHSFPYIVGRVAGTGHSPAEKPGDTNSLTIPSSIHPSVHPCTHLSIQSNNSLLSIYCGPGMTLAPRRKTGKHIPFSFLWLGDQTTNEHTNNKARIINCGNNHQGRNTGGKTEIKG